MGRTTTKVCLQPGCPEFRPCPVFGHEPPAWSDNQRKRTVGKSGWQEQRDAKRIMRKHGAICHVCGEPGANQVDHVRALAFGGLDEDDNKRPIHSEPCHRLKTTAEAARARRRGKTA